jgi:hypothetical protein
MLDEATLQMQIDNIINLLENVCETEWAQPIPKTLRASWEGYECFAAYYGELHVEELAERKPLAPDSTRLDFLMDMVTSGDFSMEKPSWFTDPKIHALHQRCLVTLNPRFYCNVFPGVQPARPTDEA